MIKAGGDATLSAGQNLQLVASQVNAGNEAYLVSGKNLELKAAENQDYSFYSKTKKTSQGKKFRLDETDVVNNVGSLVSAGTNSTVVAGADLLLAGSAVTAEKGATQLVAGQDVNILAVSNADSARHERKESKSSWGGLKSSKVQDKVDEKRTTALGSMVSGETVTVAAKRDATVTGSSLVSTGDLAVQAGRDLTIDAAQNTFARTDMHKEKNRDLTGVLTGNKLGLDDMTGNQKLYINSSKHNGTANEMTLTGSTIGSSAGNVSLTAGRELKVVASDLVSTKNMELGGANVTVTSGMETASQTSKDSSRSLAVGRVIAGTVVDTANSIRDAAEAARSSDDPRLKAVKIAQAALSMYNLNNQAGDLAKQSTGFKDKTGGSAGNGSLIKIGTELANTRTKSSSEYTAQTAHQSNLNAGGKLSIIAAGDAPGTVGDLTITGSTLKADSTLLSAKNNILMQSAQNTTDRKNDGSRNRTAIGASFNIGEQNGFTIDLGAQTAKNLGSGGSVTQVNTTLDTGSLVLRSGQDTSLIGAQVRADRIDANIGGNLNILSRQDTETSKSKQNSAGFGASICIPPICYGSPVTASANLAASKMNSDYQAVTDQSGFFAGKGGYTIDVAKNTTLQGAVIASEATADKNLLLTDRLLVSDIKNKSEIKSQSAGVSVSGSYSGGATTLTPGALYGMSLNDSDHSYTRSAVSEGTIVVRNPEGAGDLVGLNRDTANANQRLDKPDEKAMQERMDLIKSSMELTKGIGDAIAAARIRAADDPNSDVNKATRLKLIDEGIANPTQAQISQRAQQDYGVGSSFQKASQAVTAVVQAAMGGSVGGALAGAAAPYLAETIRDRTKGDPTANLMAHAVLGAVLAKAGGNSALAGAAGAVAAEETARLIKENLYGDVSNENLTQAQKQTISSLATLAGGLSGSLSGKGALDAVAAAQVGRNAVENNYLSVPEATRKFVLSRKQMLGTITEDEQDELAYIDVIDKSRDEAIRGACTAGNLSSTACGNLIAPAQKALAGYGENVAYNLLYKDVYRVDAANAEAVLRGLDADSILRDITINNLAKGSDKTRAEVEEQYDNVMWMHAITVAFASAYGLKGGLTSVPKGAVTGAATAAEKAEAATGLLSTQLAKDARAYLSDIQTLTGRQFTPQQMELLKADLRENTYSRLSKEAVDLNRADFRKKVPVLRQEWEKNTGQSWPKESYTASNGETKFRYYDAHHVIENKFGGKSEWWNITPALRGLEHQGGIHRAQGPADKIFGK
ncbi:filamentous hemagglutinin [Pseudomonas poae]|uniref:Filamentous hemagglutinin n=1 Tax=Pseudomonas poae TaxID=200451 RepID=A0A7Z1GQK5_9PSED|nr:hemagglutinin repeat-containing protein [Pseudomonas poae]PFG60384.1 filamentous hemagglutinin [Pseudomonas poae]